MNPADLQPCFLHSNQMGVNNGAGVMGRLLAHSTLAHPQWRKYVEDDTNGDHHINNDKLTMGKVNLIQATDETWSGA